MKLHPQQIQIVADAILKRLLDTGAASVESREETVQRVARSVTEDLQVEDRLNDEVRELLSRHEAEMRAKGIQYHDMFKAVKQKLVRERRLIL